MNDKLVFKTDGEDKSFYKLIQVPELSGWTCYLFGNKPGGMGLSYRPTEGQVPNAFVRWMMKVCFACTWVWEGK